MSIKIDRLNNQFIYEISRIIHDEVKDKSVKNITVTDVKITNDLSFAKVYFTVYDDNKIEISKNLNKVSGFIRSKLCESIKIRKMPEIHFVYDESSEYGDNIERIIERIHNND